MREREGEEGRERKEPFLLDRRRRRRWSQHEIKHTPGEKNKKHRR